MNTTCCSEVYEIVFSSGRQRLNKLYPLCETGPSWSWSYGSWIYSYICNQGLSPLKLWVRIPLRRCILDKTLCDKVCQWLAAGHWFPPSTLVFSTNKTDRHDITKILLKVALNTISLTHYVRYQNQYCFHYHWTSLQLSKRTRALIIPYILFYYIKVTRQFGCFTIIPSKSSARCSKNYILSYGKW